MIHLYVLRGQNMETLTKTECEIVCGGLENTLADGLVYGIAFEIGRCLARVFGTCILIFSCCYILGRNKSEAPKLRKC